MVSNTQLISDQELQILLKHFYRAVQSIIISSVDVDQLRTMI